MRKTCVVSAASLLFVLGPALASARGPEVALNGYCPVCLVKKDKLVKGDPKFSSVYDGKTYVFPGMKQKRMFDADPASFVPALGGQCAVCLVEKDKHVAGLPEFHAVHDGRLFLFPSEKQQRMFERNPARYADADLALGGACPVCLVKIDKVVPGKAEFASIYDGRRYLFPGPQQKQMFDANPAAFVPAMHGNCTVCKVEMNKDVPGTAEYHLTYKDRLYVFPSEKQLKMFKADPDRYADADVAMHGYCPVCRVEMGRNVKGRPDLAVDYNGKRYLFPDQKQLDMFKRNPAKYTVE